MAHFCNLSKIRTDEEASEADKLDEKLDENLKFEEEMEERSNPRKLAFEEWQPEETNESCTNNIDVMTKNVNPEQRQDLSEKRKDSDSKHGPFESPTEPKGYGKIIPTNKKCSRPAVAFSIPVENCSTCRQPPKRLCNTTKARKASLESLNKKQALAEERRQQHKENQIQRIHERQEAARKLAQNVDTLLQQRALAQGSLTNSAIKCMSPSEILATAHLVSRNFRALTSQLGNDLSVKDKKKERMHRQCDENQNERVHCFQKKSSVAFTVRCDGGNKPGKPKTPFKKQQRKKKTLTAEDLEEKQQKAEARRNKRKQDCIQRVRENREVLLAMAHDFEKYKFLQSMTDSPKKDANFLEQNKEAALLAEKLASQFDRLNQRYSDDLTRAENFKACQPQIFFSP